MVEVYIDSDVIVSAEIPGERNHDESKKFMESALSVQKGSLNYVTSIFAFLEIASAMIRRTKNKHKAYSLLYRVQKILEDFDKTIPTDRTERANLVHETC